MRKKTFTEEQIALALREAEGGTPVTEVCRRLGVSEQSFYRWKRKYTGMGVAELRRLKQLEEENRKLKEDRGGPFAGQADAAGRAEKKVVKPAPRRRLKRISGGDVPGQRTAGLPHDGIPSEYGSVSK